MSFFNKLACAVAVSAVAFSATAANNNHDWARGSHQVDTSIGKLEYYNGFPTDETAQKLYDELDYQRAVQAYIDTVPFVAYQGWYEGLVKIGAGKVTDTPVFTKMLDASTCIFTGNETTIYGANAFFLNGKPVVLEIPAGIMAGLINNAWQQELTPIGLVGPNQGKGGKYLILPPGYEGDIPEGYQVIQSDTDKIVWMARGFVTPNQTEEGARDLLRKINGYELANAGKNNKPNIVDLGEGADDWCYTETNGYFDQLARGWEKEPGRVQDKMLQGKLYTLGIPVGEKRVAPDARLQKILDKAEVMGRSMVNTIAYASKDEDITKWEGRKYENVFLGKDATVWENDKYIEVDRRAQYTYQAITASHAMVAEWVGKGSKYFAGTVDNDGKRYDGANTYRVPVPAKVPAGRFWSVTLYDSATRSILKNKTGVASIDSYGDFERNSDGSVDIILSPNKPEGMEKNWIQTNEGAGYFFYFRVYSPEKEYYTSFIMDDVEHVKDGEVSLR
ncbi:DUF1214 domain-containing protein (plasmid) [Photobacterium sp. DA100]|uniref:DUF1214 domain-containing protein n=1 Tax=Photobacterium sp. DA100 TaxID=3027472 RepID=UPI002478AFC9|nr:DUF1214 domain-containing protein [Photobacterium sp. DA100]WEM44309.1 DUF1214 domain-containing protein [Photobacterium sp. DA100]